MGPIKTIPDRQTPTRWRWVIGGIVQGVGFRPFVYRAAHEIGVSGIVRNTPGGVIIEAQGSTTQLKTLDDLLRNQPPIMAQVKSVQSVEIPVNEAEEAFVIDASEHDAPLTAEISPDAAVCPQCLHDMRNEHDRRRFHYALVNCTNCGPRFSIIQKIPYDRVNTTMSHFAMCDECKREYDSPIDRRFHAQPTACHTCGPRISLIDSQHTLHNGDTISTACRTLFTGHIVAIKGIGGFHLACRADDEKAVQLLRQRKQRDGKPFALMVRSIAVARDLVTLSERAVALLSSPKAPIVLCKRLATAVVAPSVAPAQHRLGVMLPYSPLHHLIFDSLDPRINALVMTSANASDEPLIYEDAEARDRLHKLADAIVLHDRPIQRPVDDSVIIDSAGDAPIFLRRSRGFVPAPLELKNVDTRQRGLALGAELKSTVAVVRGSEVIVSQHLGDLSHARTYATFKKAIVDLCELWGITPQWIAHDLHPNYMSSAYGAQLAAKWHIPILRVQHHYAHAAAVLAEHGHPGPALAVVCDGTGFGPDHTVWGGELLSVDFKQFHRIGHLRCIRLAGGDASARQTWRSAMAMLFNALGKDFDQHPIAHRLIPVDKDRVMFTHALRGNTGCIASSAMGRLFDGFASLLGVCNDNSHEAEAGMILESLASQHDQRFAPQQHFSIDKKHEVMQLDFSPLVLHLIKQMEKGAATSELAGLVHEQFAAGWEALVLEAVERTGLSSVVMSGGCFCNEIFSDRLAGRFENLGLHVMRHQFTPPNDGGISFGQAAIGALRPRKQEVH